MAQRTRLFLAAFVVVTSFPLAASGALGRGFLAVTNFGDMDAVVFDHTRHAESFDCDTCHHKQGSQGGHRCGACHLAEASRNGMKIEDAAHRESVGKCWTCHFSKKARKKLDCEDCHKGSP